VTLESPVGRREAKLLAVGLSGAQVKPGYAQPGDHAVLHDMASLEDAQHAPLQSTATVDGRLGELVLQGAFASHPQAGSTKVVTAGLRSPGTLHPGIHQGRELARDTGR